MAPPPRGALVLGQYYFHGSMPELLSHYSDSSKPRAFKKDDWSRQNKRRMSLLWENGTASDQHCEDAPVKSSAPGSAVTSMTTPSGMKISSSSKAMANAHLFD